jgi:DNA-binding MarR family transcriptional regulator
MARELSRRLHKLTARLDLAAENFLRGQTGLSYARFLALYMVGFEGADTQRDLAERLAVSEPSVSRMVRLLAEAGWLESSSQRGAGNRNKLSLTAEGRGIIERWGPELEGRLAALVQAAGVPYEDYLAHTNRLLDQLDALAEARSSADASAALARRR